MPTTIKHVFVFLAIVVLASCANRSSGPQGGPKDVAPPVPKKSTPANGQTNYRKGEIAVEFDEFVALDKPLEKIIISPPQIVPPLIRTSGKKVHVSFSDTLHSNTTYSIDFTNSIVDLNERNPLEAYTFSFSTGETLDSLQIAGKLINAENLDPLANYTIGIYANLDDTAFTKTPPMRIGRTNDKGEFTIKNVKATSYHIFALNDLNRDYFYNDPNEAFAFVDSLVVPSAEVLEKTDTLRIDTTLTKEKKRKKSQKALADSLLKDSIITYKVTKFLPNDILLKASKQAVYKQHFIKAERKAEYKIDFFFFAENKEKPQIRLLNADSLGNDLLQYSAKMDSITYWLGDSTRWLADSLQFEIKYLKTDSLGELKPQTDSVFSVFKHSKVVRKDNKKQEKKTKFLSIKHNAQGAMHLNRALTLMFDAPIDSIDTAKVHFSRKLKADSIWADIPLQIEPKDSIGLRYEFVHEWDAEQEYKLLIDSTAIVNRYGLHNNKLEATFTVKGLEQYATLIVNVLNFNPKAVIQLINAKDEVLRQYPAEQDGTVFDFLAPGDYYIRLFIDENGNEKWDAGNYSEKRQPEAVYYFDKKLKLRANWDVEQEWDYLATPLLKQKPSELVGVKKTQK